MKKIFLITGFLLGGFAFQEATAQLRISFRANIGAQPVWGPVGYAHVEYYYLPDIDVFYYVPQRQYIYQERGNWVFANSLPSRYYNYDLYRGYKVVINEPSPYRNAGNYRAKYARYRGNHNQPNIRNSRESRYFENRDHPQHNKWKQDQGRKKRRS